MAMLRCSVLNQDNLLLNMSFYILHTVLIAFDEKENMYKMIEFVS